MLSSFPHLTQGSQSFSSLVKHTVEPVVSAGTIFAIAYLSGEDIDYHYSILALLKFLITFPGVWPTSTTARFASQVGSSWAIQTILLVLLGIGTDTLSVFPTRVILLCIVLMPLAVFVTCMLLKKFAWRFKLLRVGRNKAVIVGATTLAGKLFQAVKNDKMSPIDVAASSMTLTRGAEGQMQLICRSQTTCGRLPLLSPPDLAN